MYKALWVRSFLKQSATAVQATAEFSAPSIHKHVYAHFINLNTLQIK